jgi:hypothetical protein
MAFIINPGSISVPGHNPGPASNQLAAQHMPIFCEDLAKLSRQLGTHLEVSFKPYRTNRDQYGRFPFWVEANGRRELVWMPGYDLERVRYLGVSSGSRSEYLPYDGPKQSAWDFYRLYTTKTQDSWLWTFALGIILDVLAKPKRQRRTCNTK